MAANIIRMKMMSGVWNDPKMNWQAVSGMIKAERQDVLKAFLKQHGVLVRYEMEKAASRLNILPDELECEVHWYAEFGDLDDMGVSKEGEASNFSEVAHILASVYSKVRKNEYKQLSSAAQVQHLAAIDVFQKHYFEEFPIDYFHRFGIMPAYSLTEFAKRKVDE